MTVGSLSELVITIGKRTALAGSTMAYTDQRCQLQTVLLVAACFTVHIWRGAINAVHIFALLQALWASYTVLVSCVS